MRTLSIITVLFFFVSLLSGQNFDLNRKAVEMQQSDYIAFHKQMAPYINAKRNGTIVPPLPISILLAVQSNCGRELIGNNYARVKQGNIADHLILYKYKSYQTAAENIIIFPNHPRHSVEAAVWVFAKMAQNKTLQNDTDWLNLIFGPGADLEALADYADAAYRALTGRPSGLFPVNEQTQIRNIQSTPTAIQTSNSWRGVSEREWQEMTNRLAKMETRLRTWENQAAQASTSAPYKNYTNSQFEAPAVSPPSQPTSKQYPENPQGNSTSKGFPANNKLSDSEKESKTTTGLTAFLLTPLTELRSELDVEINKTIKHYNKEIEKVIAEAKKQKNRYIEQAEQKARSIKDKAYMAADLQIEKVGLNGLARKAAVKSANKMKKKADDAFENELTKAKGEADKIMNENLFGPVAKLKEQANQEIETLRKKFNALGS